MPAGPGTPATSPFGLFFYRIAGAAFFDAGMYETIEHDRRATIQAATVVLLSSIAAGVGASGWHGPDPALVLAFSGIALVTWTCWAMLTFQIGTRWLRVRETDADVGEMLRTVGFAAAPGLLQVFAVFPQMRQPVFITCWIWMFGAMVFGVRHALDYDRTSRAVLVCALGAALTLLVVLGIGVLFGPTAA